ncbi:MAG: HPP family protein [Planctomycetota bacterium]
MTKSWSTLSAQLGPVRLAMQGGQRRRIVLGMLLGLAVTGCVGWLLPLGSSMPWLAASMGASAVLLFALPSSPLAQPWAVVVGSMTSAAAGVVAVHCASVLPTALVPAVAAALAAAGMLLLRCLHAPGGGTAIVPVLAGIGDPMFVLHPVGANAVVLVASAWLFHRLCGQRYPHPAHEAPTPPANTPRPFDDATVDALLERHGDWIDLPRDELRQLLTEADALRAERSRGLDRR